MTDDRALAALARRAGIAVEWTDAFGKRRQVAPPTLRAMLRALGLAAATPREVSDSRKRLAEESSASTRMSLVTAEAGAPIVLGLARGGPARLTHEDGRVVAAELADRGEGRWELIAPRDWGYWQLSVGREDVTIAVAPARCFGVGDAVQRARCWGVAAQVYALRSAGDLGVGTFGGLARLGRATAALDAGMLAASPVHAMFAARPGQVSPYSPSNRLFLNVLHGDASELCRRLELAGNDEFEARRRQADGASLIDWPAAARLTLEALERAFVTMRQRGLIAGYEDADDAFGRFRRDRGPALEDHACFEALHERAADTSGRPAGPMPERNSASVTQFVATDGERIAFHAFAQWRADVALADAQAACRDAGMPIGLIADLAVGVDPSGSQVWSAPEDFLPTLSVGAPPDLFNPLGQSWGLSAFSPPGLMRTGYAPFIALLRALLRHAGGVRIDHILGLRRLWLVPHGAGAGDGAYLQFPLVDLLRILRLESWRHRAIVIGEDLGTVPPGFRATLAAAGVLGTRVLWFEQDSKGLFRSPGRWSPHAIAMSTTHDLPTIAGWWSGRDLEWRSRLRLYPDDDGPAAASDLRRRQRPLLWRALSRAGTASGAAPPFDQGPAVIEPVCRFLGRTRAPAVLLPLEDAIGTEEQPNLPGTIDEHSNWRQRMPSDIETTLADPQVLTRLQAITAAGR
jgi:4-alpha-glucanotransferase